jgi:hypothetical protein
MTRTVVFVCPHGAGKSRMAAAFFNAVAPDGWHATSAGQEPAVTVSPDAVHLMAGSTAASYLDREPPRPLEAIKEPARVVAIDCEVPGAERWALTHQQIGEAMRDELERRAVMLAREARDADR